VSLLEAIVLGAVQGLTEFIPVSSSGHLVLVPEALGWDRPGLAFDVLLHVGSLAALLFYFRRDLWGMITGLRGDDPSSRRAASLLVVGTIPAALAGFFFGDFFEGRFEDPAPAALQLFLTAAILIGAEQALRLNTRRTERQGTQLRTIDDLRPRDALAVGLAQAMALLPGISRSGSTIGAGLALKLSRDDAARFAFLLAIPALFGAALVKIPELDQLGLGAGEAIGGLLSSLVFSYVAVSGLIRFLKTRTLYPFAAYCFVAAIVFYLLVR
jgi:undecaprenyl-diphosphatase